MFYLASPYSHPDQAVREQRYNAACRAMITLMRQGHVVFSPVVLSHPLVAHGMGTGWQHWEAVDREFLERCDEVLVLKLYGWESSRGVAAEIEMARELGKRVGFLAPNDVVAEAGLATMNADHVTVTESLIDVNA